MEWAEKGKGNRNPVLVVNGIGGLAPIVVDASCGDSIEMDILNSYDPDGDDLEYKWWIMPEVGGVLPDGCLTFGPSGNAELKIPEDYKGDAIHVICECTDSGTIPLTSYRRVIVRVK